MLQPPLQPMLLSDRLEPFNSPDYLFEVKWDGYRTLIFKVGERTYLQSRNQKDLTPFFPELKTLYKQLKAERAVLDGEICSLGRDGKPIFSHLQGRLSRKYSRVKNNWQIKNPVTIIVWDILEIDGRETYQLPLLERRDILEERIVSNNRIQLSPFILEKGIEFYQNAAREQLEGIVAKKIDSPYEFKRSSFWYKIKVWQYMEVVICGFSQDRTSLVVAGQKIKQKQKHEKGKGQEQEKEKAREEKELEQVEEEEIEIKKEKENEHKENKQLVNMGRVKLALDRKEEEALFRFLPEIATPSPLFPEKTGQITWVKPVIKCQVRYTEITRHQTFRHGFAVKLLI